MEQNAPVDVENKILKQVEFYFSDSNFPKDKFLRAQAAQNEEGYVPISVIASFTRMKAITEDQKAIVDALRKSEHLKVSEDGTMVRRIAPLPEEDTVNGRSIYTKGWPLTATIEEVERAYAPLGKVLCVRLRRNTLKKERKDSAFVEFSTEEEAKRAVSGSPLTVGDRQITALMKGDYFAAKREQRRKAKEERKAQQQHKGQGTKRKVEEAQPAQEQGAQPAQPAEEAGEAAPAFTKGLIVRVAGLGADQTRETLKEAFEKLAPKGVAYVDYSKGQPEAYLRFNVPEDAQAAATGFTGELGGKTPQLALLQGSEEEQYWARVRERKAGAKTKRGGKADRGGGKRRKRF